MTWYVDPSTQPADLGKYLIAHGLAHTEDETGMAVDLLALNADLPTPSSLMIQHISDVEMLQKWLGIVTTSFRYPDFVANVLFDLYANLGFGQCLPWQLYIGSLNGEPVAASRLFLAAGVAGIYSVATIPKMRRQGIGTAITLAPLREARNMGYRIGILRAAQTGLGVYRRLGFQEYCRFGIYVKYES